MRSVSETAALLATRGKGILASDESVPTIGKRLEKAGLVNDEPTRRAYRDVFYAPPRSGSGSGAPLGAAGLSGAILFKEALGHSCCSVDLNFVEALKQQGVLVGVKVDSGLEPLQHSGALPGETQTRGLLELPSVVRDAASQGASFAKFRCALRMRSDGQSGPSEAAVDANARQLGEYAAVCQQAGGDGGGDQQHALCPVVEPELLIDGAHDAAAFETASARVVSGTIAALWRQPGASLEALLLKPQMVVPGSEWAATHRPGSGGGNGNNGNGGLPISPDEVAARTLRVMRACVPPAVPGIMFLSGGQTERQATENLDALNAASSSSSPWSLSFSFGRGLQASVLKTWVEAGGGRPGASSTDEERERAASSARAVAVALVEANALAAEGKWRASGRRHPSVMEDGDGGSLHETFRGHY